MHKFIIGFGTFSARGTKNLRAITPGGNFHFLQLRFRAQRKPKIPAANKIAAITVFVQSGDVTKIAVGPSAPPMIPMLRAFAYIIITPVVSFRNYIVYSGSCQTSELLPEYVPLTTHQKTAIII